MTGHAGKKLTRHGVVPADVNLLVKPFSSKQLAETAQKVIGRHGRPLGQ